MSHKSYRLLKEIAITLYPVSVILEDKMSATWAPFQSSVI